MEEEEEERRRRRRRRRREGGREGGREKRKGETGPWGERLVPGGPLPRSGGTHTGMPK
jgi:hypothetical protein